MPARSAQIAASLRALVPRKDTREGEAALKAFLYKHRHPILAALERDAARAAGPTADKARSFDLPGGGDG